MESWLGLPTVEKYKDLNLNSLSLNRAYVIVNTTIDNVGLYSVDRNCFDCPYELIKKFSANKEVIWQVDTSVMTSWTILNTKDWNYVRNNYRSGLICKENPTFGEFGVYRLNVGMCNVQTEVEPANSYLPLLLCGLILLTSFLFYAASKRIFKYRKNETKEDLVHDEQSEDKMRSLHFLRGLLMIIIVFTTAGGGGYPIFTNTYWGISIPEATFCVLAWTLGVHVPQAMDKAVSNGRKKWFMIGDIALKSLVLLILCLIIDHSLISISIDIIWSPFKRIAVAYLIAAGTYVLTTKQVEIKVENFISKIISTIVLMIWSWIVFMLILAVFVISMYTFAEFNCFSGGLKNPEANCSNSLINVLVRCDNNYTDFANDLFLGDLSLLVNVDGYVGYSGGLLGTLTAILLALIGLKAGVILANFENPSERLKLWLTWATVFGALGVAIAGLSELIAFNIRPIAAIFLISSLSTYILTFISWISSHKQQRIAPVVSMGHSFLPILFGHLLFANCPPFSTGNNWNCHFWYLLDNIWTILLWMIIGVIIIKTKLRITVM